MVKILFLTNNEISLPLLNWLASKEKVSLYSKKLSIDIINDTKPDFIISYNYKHIILQDIIKIFPKGNIINLHISLLPWNRGAYPNFWSFIDNTPKGVSIHMIDEGIDTGEIIFQKEIDINEEIHTLRSSYILLNKEIQNLFKNNWEKIKRKQYIPIKQINKGSFHTKKDFEKIKHLIQDTGWDISIKELKKRYKNWSIIQ